MCRSLFQGNFWYFNTILDKAGTFIAFPHEETDSPSGVDGVWDGFWDEINTQYKKYKPRKNNDFIFKSVTTGPVTPTIAPPTCPAPSPIRKDSNKIIFLIEDCLIHITILRMI